jgi:hypothetical protein
MKFERTGIPLKLLYGAHRGIGVALIAVAAAICIAACGGSSNAASVTKSTSTTSKTSKTTSYAALRACLSKHGVTLPTGGRGAGGRFGGGTHAGTTGSTAPPAGGPPSGAPGAGGGFGGGGFGGATNSKFAKALKACGGKAGGFAGGFRGGAGGARPTFSKATLASFVACVRKSGYPAMPDAKTNTSTGGFFPTSVEKNAKFQKASVKCESILRKAAGATVPGGANQSTTTSSSSA